MHPGWTSISGWTKKSAAPLNFERWLKGQRVALYRSATLARTVLPGSLCEKPLRVYILRPRLPKLGAEELEGPRLSLGVGFRVRAERRCTNIPRKISFTLDQP